MFGELCDGSTEKCHSDDRVMYIDRVLVSWHKKTCLEFLCKFPSEM